MENVLHKDRIAELVTYAKSKAEMCGDVAAESAITELIGAYRICLSVAKEVYECDADGLSPCVLSRLEALLRAAGEILAIVEAGDG